MVFYLIPLLFIDICLFCRLSKFYFQLGKSLFYRILGMLAIGLLTFITCEVLLDIIEYYYNFQFIHLSVNPLYALVVSGLIGFVYEGNKVGGGIFDSAECRIIDRGGEDAIGKN